MTDVPKGLFDSAIRNQVNLERFSEGVRQKVVGILNDAQTSIIKQIATDSPKALTDWSKTRLTRLSKNVDRILRDNFGYIKSVTSSELGKLSVQQGLDAVKSVNRVVGVELFDITLTNEGLKALAENTMVDGAVIGQWWDNKTLDYQQKFARQMADAAHAVQLGTVRGESVGEMIRRVKGSTLAPGLMKNVKREATALVRTSVMQVAHAARHAMYEANADLIDGYEVIATLDARTTPTCRAYDKKRWRRNPADGSYSPVGHNLVYPGPPPYHWNCFIDGQIPIYTSKGWKKIRDIGVGDLVLTHKGRFRKVTELLHRSSDGPVDIVTFGLVKGNKVGTHVTMTEDHPVLVNGRWKSAKNIKLGDKVSCMAKKCARDGRGGYQFVGFEVTVLKKRRTIKGKRLYNFSVEEDESYIAKGFVVHNCRSAMIPVLKEFEDLVSDKSPLSSKRKARLLKDPKGVRASMGGPVKGETTYNEWLKSQSRGVQLDVLGPTRWKLWSENKLSMADMVHQNGRPLLIKELKGKYEMITPAEAAKLESEVKGAAEEAVAGFKENTGFGAVGDKRVKRLIDECF